MDDSVLNLRLACRINKHMNIAIGLESIYRNAYKQDVIDIIIRSFYHAYCQAEDDTEFLQTLNIQYLKYMINISRKLNNIDTCRRRIPIGTRVSEYTYNIYYKLRDAMSGCNKTRTLELACFYYFHIMPNELKKTYY